MVNMRSALRRKRTDGANGFTLIELLVVVVILGILIAIAIPLYLNYRKSANDASAKSDLKNALVVLEQCNTDSALPTAAFNLAASGAAGDCTGKINLSSNTSFLYAPGTDTPRTFIVYTKNGGGSTVYCYASKAGGSVAKTATGIPAANAPATYLAACA